MLLLNNISKLINCHQVTLPTLPTKVHLVKVMVFLVVSSIDVRVGL